RRAQQSARSASAIGDQAQQGHGPLATDDAFHHRRNSGAAASRQVLRSHRHHLVTTLPEGTFLNGSRTLCTIRCSARAALHAIAATKGSAKCEKRATILRGRRGPSPPPLSRSPSWSS